MADPAWQGTGNPPLKPLPATARAKHPFTASVVIPSFRDATRAVALARALLQDPRVGGCKPQVIVVDDGSGDGSAARIRDELRGLATVVELESNIGRAAARNAGARLAVGDVLLFLDSDCLPMPDDLLACHFAAWKADTVASTGPVHSRDGGFWGRYQRATAQRMAKRIAAGDAFAATAANLMVDRRAFINCGGFDPRYRGYGFEDRDLLLRLLDHGKIVWSADAVVMHRAETRMSTVAAKLDEAGQTTAPVFRVRHPHAYRQLSYAAIDATLHPWLRPVGRWLCPRALSHVGSAEALLQARWIPYPLRAAYVRVISALAFLHGTTRDPQA